MTNSRFEDLEKRAKKIQNKKVVKKTIFLFVPVIVIAVYLCMNQKAPTIASNFSKNENIQVAQVKKAPKEAKTYTLEPIIQKEIKKEIQNIQEVTVEKKKPLYDTVSLSLELPQEVLHVKADKKIVAEMKEEKAITKIQENKNEFIISVKPAKAEDVLLRDYDAKNDFESAMKLGVFYFETDKYSKAIYWSKRASRIKPNSPAPWIIYAKSKNELGRRGEAIKALENYLNFFTSKDIEVLLTQLKGDKK